MKGSMQVDFALALATFILVFSFLMSSSLKFILPAKEIGEKTVMYQNLVGLVNGMTEDKNLIYNSTSSLFMMSRFYYVFLNVSSSQPRNASFVLRFPSTINKSSIRVYYPNLTEVPSNVTSWNGTHINVTIGVDGQESFFVFASDKNFSSPSYGIDLSDVNNTGVSYENSNYTFTWVFDVEKFNEFNKTDYDTAKSYLGLKHFLVTVGEKRFGKNPYPTADIYSVERNVIYVNETGSLKLGELNVKIW